MKNKKPLAITTGDYNGIGPEIIVKALKKLDLPKESVVIIGDKKLFPSDLSYRIIHVDAGEIQAGKETAEAGEFCFQCLLKACAMAQDKEISAIVTAPVSKNALHLAGHAFSGQTEVLEKFLSHENQKADMLFVSGDFRVLLLTRHIPLKDVKITQKLILDKIEGLVHVLKNSFEINEPKIAICSLNPHAGENGLLGLDEIEEFEPAIDYLRTKGILITNPLPADTLFVKAARAHRNGTAQPFDCYIACYHDQGLIPMKVLAMDTAVNMTIGLDIIRTSPAHGTAYDIAGRDTADESSMIAAIREVL